MNAAPFRIEPADGLITITAGHTPAANIHHPESSYCRYYWVPVIGSSAWLIWANLVAWLPDTDGPTIDINYAQLAASIGTRPARLTRTLQRVAAFHLAYTIPAEPATLYLKRAAPTLSKRMLDGLADTCPALAAAHDHILTTAA
jgi:hypothetical protein